MHVDEWLDQPAVEENEKKAKEWLEHFRKPEVEKDYNWLRDNPLFCIYKEKQYRCIGCSRFGDIWLTKDFEREYGYDLRISIEDCSEWSGAPK